MAKIFIQRSQSVGIYEKKKKKKTLVLLQRFHSILTKTKKKKKKNYAIILHMHKTRTLNQVVRVTFTHFSLSSWPVGTRETHLVRLNLGIKIVRWLKQ